MLIVIWWIIYGFLWIVSFVCKLWHFFTNLDAIYFFWLLYPLPFLRAYWMVIISLFSFLWECLDFSFIAKKYFHCILDSALSIASLKKKMTLENVPLLSSTHSFWGCHLNYFFLKGNSFLSYCFPDFSLSLDFKSLIMMFLHAISLGLSNFGICSAS